MWYSVLWWHKAIKLRHFFSLFLAVHLACGISVTHPGTDPGHWQWKARILTTRYQGAPHNFKTKYGYLSVKSSDIFQSKCRKLINFVSKGREETRPTKIMFKIVLLRAKSHKLHCHEDTWITSLSLNNGKCCVWRESRISFGHNSFYQEILLKVKKMTYDSFRLYRHFDYPVKSWKQFLSFSLFWYNY